MTAIHLTKSGFERRVASMEQSEWKFLGERPALLDFYASWCGPCKTLSPLIDEMAEEYAGRVDIYKVDVDQEQELAEKFAIRTIPTLILVPLHGEPQRSVGLKTRAELREMLDSMIK